MSTNEFVPYVLELLTPLGHARAKRMSGGHGIYLDDLFIALIAFERLYLKVDDATRAAFEAARCEPFVYSSAKAEVTMSYWTAPADALESSDEMRPWARRAIEAALRAKAVAKPKPKPKRATAEASKTTPATRKATAAKPGRASTRRSGVKR